MPNGVADAGRIALVCWALATFTLLNWLAIWGREVPEISDWLIDIAQKIILDRALVVNATESASAHVLEGVPKSALRRCESLGRSTLETAGLRISLQMREAARLRDAAPALIFFVKVRTGLAAGSHSRVAKRGTPRSKHKVNAWAVQPT